MNDVIKHYDGLIDENNDPVRDPQFLKSYMDKCDGHKFIESMQRLRAMMPLSTLLPRLAQSRCKR